MSPNSFFAAHTAQLAPTLPAPTTVSLFRNFRLILSRFPLKWGEGSVYRGAGWYPARGWRPRWSVIGASIASLKMPWPDWPPDACAGTYAPNRERSSPLLYAHPSGRPT